MNWILTEDSELLCLETGTVIDKQDLHSVESFREADVFTIRVRSNSYETYYQWKFDSEQERDGMFAELVKQLGISAQPYKKRNIND